MKNIWIALVGLTVCIAIGASCNKTSLVGAELFENDKLNLQFTDTLSINALTDAPTPILMYVKGATPYDNLPIGNANDAYFGKFESSIYAQFGLKDVTAPIFPSLDTAKIDSIRLILPYAGSVYVYGDTTVSQKFVVYRLTKELKADTIYSNYADEKFPANATALGSLTFKPTPTTTSQRVQSALPGATKNDTFTDVPHISIPLDINFGRDIMKLSATQLRDTAFQTWLNGLVIKAETPANCMLNLNIGTSTTAPTGQFNRSAGIYIYYRNNGTDTTRRVYAFGTSGQPRYANYKNDYSNGKIKEFVNNPKKADSLVFLQSLTGSATRLEFPNLRNLGKVAINRAELEFTINEDADIKTYPALEQLLLLDGTTKISNGNFVANSPTTFGLAIANTRGIYDIIQSGYGGVSGFSIPSDFGGVVVTENGVRKYKMNITRHLQYILNGIEGTQITLAPYLQYIKAGRVVLYGPKHSKYRAKLNLIFTKI